MLGIFGTLSLAQRSMQTEQQAVEVAGQNIANVNNPAYSRQRVVFQTTATVPTSIGVQGTGADVAAIEQVRNAILDRQVRSEASVSSYWSTQQGELQLLEGNLGQQIDAQTLGPDGTPTTSSAAGSQGISEGLSDLFNAFQSLSTDPSSLAEREVLLQKAQNLTTQLNQVSQRVDDQRDSLNASIQEDVTSANQLLSTIADLNGQITNTELATSGKANDLRDLRQQKIEELARLVDISTTTEPNGAVDVSIGGVTLVSGPQVSDTLEAYDAGGGQYLVRTQTGGQDLTLTGGSIQGTIDVRDGALATLSDNLNTLASTLIAQVNAIHRNGYGLGGSTNADFFVGSDASDIAVNPDLVGDPSLIQASGANGTVGDNQVALALAQLATTSQPALNNQTFSQSYAQTVSALGQSVASANTQVANQKVVQQMLQQQRDSVSGVSLDEEMTDLVRFQRAYEASAHLISILDGMLETLVSMKQS